MIVKAQMRMDIMILLGNFHLQMSFLGGIGYAMKNSGLPQASATVYGDKSVQGIMTGKACERTMMKAPLLGNSSVEKTFTFASSF